MYGHVAVVLAAPLPDPRLRPLLAAHPTLLAFHARMQAVVADAPPPLVGSQRA